MIIICYIICKNLFVILRISSCKPTTSNKLPPILSTFKSFLPRKCEMINYRGKITARRETSCKNYTIIILLLISDLHDAERSVWITKDILFIKHAKRPVNSKYLSTLSIIQSCNDIHYGHSLVNITRCWLAFYRGEEFS